MRLLLYNIRYAVGGGASMHMPLPGAGYVLGNKDVLPEITRFVKSVDPDIVGLIEVGLGLLPHGEGPGSSNEGTNEAEGGCLHREGKDRGGRHLSVV